MSEAIQARDTIRTRRVGFSLHRHMSRALLYFFVLLGALFFTVPFLWSISSALKGPWEILEYPPSLVPDEFRWQNFVQVFQEAPYGRWLRNTVTVVIIATVGELLTASLVAYGFARYRFPGRNVLFALLLSTVMLPWQVRIIPSYLMFRAFGWLDTLRPLTVPSWFGGSAFHIFLLRQFFMTIPLDFDDAARMDGANFVTIWRHVIVPLSIPAMTTVMLFSFLAHWGEFMAPLIYLNSAEKFTLALGLRYFENVPMSTTEPRQHLLMAASLMMILPCVAVFFVGQNYFVKGMVMSGIKG